MLMSIILIYEYSLIHDSKPNEKRPNLLRSMNNSLETLPFEVKFNKEKLDPAIVQLLPLILKTLKQNIDLDKIVEDSSSLSPPYIVKKETKELSTKTPARQNLLRSPSSRFYTIEYKTFPILYFHNPTRNTEHFTKIRKIRDYQRIMNYLDKMINHRVSIGTPMPMAKYIYGTYKTNKKEYTTPMTSVENPKTNNKNMQPKKTKTITTQTVLSNCQCSEKLSNLFSKFIGHLTTLLPNLSGKGHGSTSCNHNKQKTIEKFYNKEKTGYKTLSSTSSQDLLTTTPKINNEYTSYTPQINVENRLYNLENIFQSQDDTMHDLPKLIKPNEQMKMNDRKDYSYERLRTKQYFNEISNRSYINEKLLTPIVGTEVTPPLKESETIVIDSYEPMGSINLGISELPVSMRTDYENYNDTNLNIIDYFKMLDAHSLELVKEKIIPNRKNTERYMNIKNKNSIENTLENSSLASKDYNIDLLNNNENVSNIINVELNNSSTTTTHPTTNEYFTENKSHSTINTAIKDYVTTENLLNNTKIDPTLRSDGLTLEEEIERAPLDDSDTSLKNLENIIAKLNDTYEYTSNNNNEASEYDWELVKIMEDKYTNSMIPQSRSSYLEIQRGYWKKEEHNDYNNNINHYNLLN